MKWTVKFWSLSISSRRLESKPESHKQLLIIWINLYTYLNPLVCVIGSNVELGKQSCWLVNTKTERGPEGEKIFRKLKWKFIDIMETRFLLLLPFRCLFVLPLFRIFYFYLRQIWPRRTSTSKLRMYENGKISATNDQSLCMCLFALKIDISFNWFQISVELQVWVVFPCELFCVISIFLLIYEYKLWGNSIKRLILVFIDTFDTLDRFVCIIFGQWIKWTMIFQSIRTVCDVVMRRQWRSTEQVDSCLLIRNLFSIFLLSAFVPQHKTDSIVVLISSLSVVL